MEAPSNEQFNEKSKRVRHVKTPFLLNTLLTNLTFQTLTSPFASMGKMASTLFNILSIARKNSATILPLGLESWRFRIMLCTMRNSWYEPGPGVRFSTLSTGCWKIGSPRQCCYQAVCRTLPRMGDGTPSWWLFSSNNWILGCCLSLQVVNPNSKS